MTTRSNLAAVALAGLTLALFGASSASTGDSGTVLVPGPLEPGQEFKLSDVLSDDAVRGAPCTADFAS
jgi:hypothetical protein